MENSISLIGAHEVSMDVKGRFMLPKTFRDQLPEKQKDQFVLSIGFQNNLKLYPKSVWMELANIFKQYSPLSAQVDKLKRAFNAHADLVECDSAGRITISKSLVEKAGLGKNIKLISLGDTIEIWDVEKYNEYASTEEDLSALSNEITGGSYLSPFK